MKIIGTNYFTSSKDGTNWLVISGIQKYNTGNGVKKGYQVLPEIWIKNPEPAIVDKAEVGSCCEIIYRQEGNRQVFYDIVPSEETFDNF